MIHAENIAPRGDPRENPGEAPLDDPREDPRIPEPPHPDMGEAEDYDDIPAQEQENQPGADEEEH